MKSSRLLINSVFTTLLLLGSASPCVIAQTSELGPRGGSGEEGPNSGPLTVITDGGDPILQNRYGVIVRPPHRALNTLHSVGSRLPALPIAIVVDPVTSAVIGFEPLGLANSTMREGTSYVGGDGYVRITLPALSMHHR